MQCGKYIDIPGNIEAIVIVSCAYNRKKINLTFLQILLNFLLKNTIMSGFIYSVLSDGLVVSRFWKNKHVFSTSKYIN